MQVKDIQLSQLQGEYCIQTNVHPIPTVKAKKSNRQTWSITGQLQTVNKVLQAKDRELQAVQKLMKGSEGEDFHEDLCT